nr:hypothetical protein [Acidobacteriota bacterium]
MSYGPFALRTYVGTAFKLSDTASPNAARPAASTTPVWRGATQEAKFADQFDAIRLARTLANEHQVPAGKIWREWEGLC